MVSTSQIQLVGSMVVGSYDSLGDAPAKYQGMYTEGMRLMGVPMLHAAGLDGEGVVIGVIDSGIDPDHPDLAGRVIGQRDYVKDGLRPIDYHPHGTHVTGILGANGKLIGMAPKATFRDYRVLGVDGSGKDTDLIQALHDATDDGCHIINMSLSTTEDVPGLHEAIQYAVGKGILCVCAAGNRGANTLEYPAFYPEVVEAGAAWITYNRETGQVVVVRALFSATNNRLDLLAPGWEVISCAPGGRYMVMSGTSQGAPHVAGYAALKRQKAILRLGKEPSENSLWESIKTDTVDIMTPGLDEYSGAGFLTAYPSLPERRRVQVAIGVPARVVDGRAEKLDVAPVLDNDRTMTPTRHTHEPMGDTVSWDQVSHTVTIDRWIIPGHDKAPTNAAGV